MGDWQEEHRVWRLNSSKGRISSVLSGPATAVLASRQGLFLPVWGHFHIRTMMRTYTDRRLE